MFTISGEALSKFRGGPRTVERSAIGGGGHVDQDSGANHGYLPLTRATYCRTFKLHLDSFQLLYLPLTLPDGSKTRGMERSRRSTRISTWFKFERKRTSRSHPLCRGGPHPYSQYEGRERK
ncbi:hypothetical protein PM082_006602 [Marasmius tenuissimus]|nr:hypothetical protein PM082_006602 [Marasmius tenuissimus]